MRACIRCSKEVPLEDIMEDNECRTCSFASRTTEIDKEKEQTTKKCVACSGDFKTDSLIGGLWCISCYSNDTKKMIQERRDIQTEMEKIRKEKEHTKECTGCSINYTKESLIDGLCICCRSKESIKSRQEKEKEVGNKIVHTSPTTCVECHASSYYEYTIDGICPNCFERKVIENKATAKSNCVECHKTCYSRSMVNDMCSKCHDGIADSKFPSHCDECRKACYYRSMVKGLCPDCHERKIEGTRTCASCSRKMNPHYMYGNLCPGCHLEKIGKEFSDERLQEVNLKRCFKCKEIFGMGTIFECGSCARCYAGETGIKFEKENASAIQMTSLEEQQQQQQLQPLRVNPKISRPYDPKDDSFVEHLKVIAEVKEASVDEKKEEAVLKCNCSGDTIVSKKNGKEVRCITCKRDKVEKEDPLETSLEIQKKFLEKVESRLKEQEKWSVSVCLFIIIVFVVSFLGSAAGSLFICPKTAIHDEILNVTSILLNNYRSFDPPKTVSTIEPSSMHSINNKNSNKFSDKEVDRMTDLVKLYDNIRSNHNSIESYKHFYPPNDPIHNTDKYRKAVQKFKEEIERDMEKATPIIEELFGSERRKDVLKKTSYDFGEILWGMFFFFTIIACCRANFNW